MLASTDSLRVSPMVDDKLPPSACPWCASLNTVRTAMLVTRAFFFCLSCGKGFERRIEGEQARAAQPPKLEST
jgi:transposase-like protein